MLTYIYILKKVDIGLVCTGVKNVNIYIKKGRYRSGLQRVKNVYIDIKKDGHRSGLHRDEKC